MEIKQHYDTHLANYYSWMFGDFAAKLKENKHFFERHNIKPLNNNLALDLGAGSGFQTIPLAKVGFMVKSIDFSSILLQELKERAADLSIEIIEDDFIDFIFKTNLSPELIICMGDTITHLPDHDTLRTFIFQSYKILISGGKLILSFRDLTYELKDEQRFIPVKSDDGRIFTCFLEYFPDFVKVHDIVHEKGEEGWRQKISSYKKIKISRKKIEELVTEVGYSIVSLEEQRGFIYLIAEK